MLIIGEYSKLADCSQIDKSKFTIKINLKAAVNFIRIYFLITMDKLIFFKNYNIGNEVLVGQKINKKSFTTPTIPGLWILGWLYGHSAIAELYTLPMNRMNITKILKRGKEQNISRPIALSDDVETFSFISTIPKTASYLSNMISSYRGNFLLFEFHWSVGLLQSGEL